MTRSFLAFLLAAALFAVPSARAAFPLTNEYGTPSVAPLVKRVTPAVVNIAVHAQVQINNPLFNDPLFRQFFRVPPSFTQETQTVGSGVIVDAANGYVLTNNHVVQNADTIQVTLRDKRSFRAKLIGRDPSTDVAVLKIPADDLTALTMGDSDQVEVGDFVLAIGNPFGLGQTVTSGIVSALGRSGLRIEGYEDFIQTDASINPGNSGGALIDLEGRLIGINTAIVAPSGGNVGVGFAIPINMARSIMDQIIKFGHVEHGYIGVAVQDLTPDIAAALHTNRTDGALIANIASGSPADQAGLQPGDIIIAVDNTPITNRAQFLNMIGMAHLHHDLAITYERSGTQNTVAVAVGAQPGADQADESDSQQ
jgi:Do/DeqQ family serine protease